MAVRVYLLAPVGAEDDGGAGDPRPAGWEDRLTRRAALALIMALSLALWAALWAIGRACLELFYA